MVTEGICARCRRTTGACMGQLHLTLGGVAGATRPCATREQAARRG